MFDFGFWELSLIMVVALLVVGPKRLPILAAQVGRWIGKAKRIAANIRADIESEIEAAEIKEMLEKQQSEIGELKEILQDTRKELEDGDRELVRDIEKRIESSASSAGAAQETEKRIESSASPAGDAQEHEDAPSPSVKA